MRIYAVGDVHGQLEKLQAAHARIQADQAGYDGPSFVVHVGDLVDRGESSRQVIDYLMAGQRAGQPWRVLMGNHDRYLPRFIEDPHWIDAGLSSGKHWIDHEHLGAASTLASYGVEVEGRSHAQIHADALRAVPMAHIRWLRSLPLWQLTPKALFVHAGIRPGVDLQDQTEHDLVWIRKGFLDDPRDHGVLVVHGHTVVDRVTHFGNRLAIDTGAAYGGPMAAVVFDGTEIYELTDAGRAPVARQEAHVLS